MRTCGACSETYRTGRLAIILSEDGANRGRVCKACAKRGMVVVARRVAPRVAVTMKRSDETARVLRMLRTLRAACDDDRRAEGLDQAIAILAPKERLGS